MPVNQDYLVGLRQDSVSAEGKDLSQQDKLHMGYVFQGLTLSLSVLLGHMHHVHNATMWTLSDALP